MMHTDPDRAKYLESCELWTRLISNKHQANLSDRLNHVEKDTEIKKVVRKRMPAPEKLGSIADIAKSKGGECLSDAYNPRKMRFKCEKGHEWETTPGSIFNGSWCRKCWLAKRWGKTEKYKLKEYKNATEKA